MVKLEYVRRRMRKKAVAIASLTASIVIATFSIVSFLGQRTGSFTVTIQNDNVNLGLLTSTKTDEHTSFIRLEDLAPMEAYCFHNFENSEGQIDFSTIDSEETDSTIGATINSEGEIVNYTFFKYTFYVKNYGPTTADYTMKLRMLSNTADSVTQKKLDSILRTVVIVDGEYTVYAKKSTDATHYSKDDPNTKTTLEYVCGQPDDPFLDYGLAEPFVSSSVLFELNESKFEENDIIRYTLLFWIEGDDAECTGDAPNGCKLRLGVEIQAYENQE